MDSNHMQSLLQQAVTAHKQGNLSGADVLYRQVLDIDPLQFDALHLSGVIARQRGEAELAVDLISRAIAVNSQQAIAHCNLGAAFQDAGKAQDALWSYDRALKLNPLYAMALNNRGNALKNLDRFEEALASYERALQISPGYPEAFLNRGITLQLMHRYADALDSFDQALAVKPAYTNAMYARGVTLQSLHQYEAALQAYDDVLQLRPEHGEAICSRGTALQRLQRYDDALADYDRAIQLYPSHAKAHQYRGNALRSLLRHDEAIAAYDLALNLGADAQQIHYALAALGVGAAPAASPVAYVKELFDQYAEHFDTHLVDLLDYDMPRLLTESLRRHAAGSALDILDMGCGTGLCAPYLRGMAQTLRGVDLSANMLGKAAQRNLYDHLACAELVDYLCDKVAAYDVMIAADVLVYIGDLAPLFAGVKRALRTDGLFSFSVESTEGTDVELRASNRYAHSRAYLEQLATHHGYVILDMTATSARRDRGVAIASLAVLLRAA